MSTKDLIYKQDLCASLNMNFDEANQLFESETLEDMKMAKVNGGIAPIVWASIIISACGLIVSLVGVINNWDSGESNGSTGTPGLPDHPWLKLEGIDSLNVNYNGNAINVHIRYKEGYGPGTTVPPVQIPFLPT